MQKHFSSSASLVIACLFLSLLFDLSFGQFSIGGVSSQSASQSSQYPRIKIGGPLGALIPNGLSLGSGLGSMINNLISSSGSTSGSSTDSRAPNSALVNALRGEYAGYGSSSSNHASAAIGGPYGGIPPTHPLFGASYPPSASFYNNKMNYNGYNNFAGLNSDGLFGQSGNLFGSSLGGSASAPSLSSSALYSSTNPNQAILGMD